jgi:hypothetical protein
MTGTMLRSIARIRKIAVSFFMEKILLLFFKGTCP